MRITAKMLKRTRLTLAVDGRRLINIDLHSLMLSLRYDPQYLTQRMHLPQGAVLSFEVREEPDVTRVAS